MRSRAVLFASLATLAACASDEAIDRTYDPCSPLTIAVDADIAPAERAGVDDAITAWGAVIPVQITIEPGAEVLGMLSVQFEPGDTPYRAMYWDTFGEISIGRDRLAPEDYGLAIAHEMGHAFGLHHVEPNDRSSVMNVGNLEHSPTQDDASAVAALWESCRPQM